MNEPATKDIIRFMTEADIPEVSNWLAELPLGRRYGFALPTLSRNLRAALERAELLLVAQPGAAPLGLAWCDPQGAFSRSAYLRLLAIHPTQAGRGLGGRLLRQVESATASHARDLLLLVSDFNTGAQRFYEAGGYERVGALPAFVLPDVTELIYRKRLDEEVTPPQP
ncbi:MAG TPA: GNAT family N-acetyltransferase [Trueperaceae bacterium]